MSRRYGVMLFDETEVIFRIYETTDKHWKLLHYHCAQIAITSSPETIDVTDIIEIVGEFFTTEYAQHIAEWRTCSRYLPKKLIQELNSALGFTIEDITPLREQELLCKGMFTELW